MIIIFELTGDYKIILPLMFAIVVATALSNAVTRDTIYTLKLRRRGITSTRQRSRVRWRRSPSRKPWAGRPDRCAPTTRCATWSRGFAADRMDSLPVVDHHGALLGVVTAVDVERAVSEHSDQATVAATLVRDTPRLHPHHSLGDAVIAFGAGDEEGIPIIGNADHEMIGWLTRRRLLRAYRQRADPPTR